MSVKVIDIVRLLADQIHKNGYQHRVLEDDIYAEQQKRIAAEKDRDHWKTARKDAIAAGELMQAEIETLKGAMAADDKRLRDAEERVWPGETRGCDAPDAMADEILHLRTKLVDSRVANINLQGQLDAARAETVDVRKRLNEETDRHRATNAEKVQHWDHLQIANKNAAELVRERDAARETILAQKRGNQYLRMLMDKLREIVGREDAMSDRLEEIGNAIDDFNDGTIEPTPCPECETTLEKLADANKQWKLVAQQREQDRQRLREYEQVVAQSNSAMDAARAEIERLRVFVETVREAVNLRLEVGLRPVFSRVFEAVAELDQPTPATEPALCPACERWKREVERINSEFVASKAELIGLRGHLRKFQAFVGKVRSVIDNDCDGLEIDEMIAALDELDDETTPVAEQAEGGQ